MYLFPQVVHLLIQGYLVDVFVANAYSWIVYVAVSSQGLRWMNTMGSAPFSLVGLFYNATLP